jgi:hypothetical protein
MSSRNILSSRYFCFHQIHSTLTSSSFAKSTRQSLPPLSLDLFSARSFIRHICLALAPFYFSLPSSNILASYSSSSLDIPLQVLLTRMPDLFARTTYLIFTNI